MLTLQGHTRRVRCLAYSPDGAVLASGGDDGVLRIWDAAAGVCLASIPSKQRAIHALVFAPDGELLVTAGLTKDVKIWYLKDTRPRVTLYGHADPVRGLALSPDGHVLVSAGGQAPRGRAASGEAIVWDTWSGRLTGSLRVNDGQFLGVAFAPEGRQVALASDRGRVVFWDPFAPPPDIRIMPSTQPFTWGMFACDALGEPLRPADQLNFLVLANDPSALVYAPDGRGVAVAVRRTVHLWDRVALAAIKILKGHRDDVTAVAFSPDGRSLAGAGRDGTVRLWETAGWSETACHDWGIGPVHCVAFAPGGMTVAAGGERDIMIWDVG